jgi:hypothetical protein
MAAFVKRLAIERIRVCPRCARGRAELRTDDGAGLVVPLDATRTRQLAGTAAADDLRTLTDLMLEQLEAGGRQPGEVVLEVADGRLRALLSFDRDGEPDVVACTAEEGVALVVRGALRFYATDEAMAHGGSPAAKHDHDGGSGTVH